MSLKLYLFGPPRLIINGETKLLNGTNSAVLSLLALSQATNFKLLRSRIAGTIWPENDEEHARQLLSNAIYRLRRLFHQDDNNLIVDKETLYLNDVWVDVVAFQARCHSEDMAAWQEAIGLYSGDLLEGHDPVWSLPLRAELRENYLNLLARTAAKFEEQGEWSRALLMANKWALADPLDEVAHTAVMQLYVQLGRYGVAIQQYEKLTELLATELAVSPLPETQQLYELIVNERRKKEQMAANPETAPFVGRQEERSQLIHQLELLKLGTGAVLLLEGEPGIGKTRLLTEISRSASWRDIRVAWGKQAEIQATAQFEPLPQLLQNLATTPWLERIKPRLTVSVQKLLSNWLPDLKPDLPNFETNFSVKPKIRPLPASMAVKKLLSLLADISPSLLILDDLQWADDRLFEILPAILDLSRERPLLFILSYRSQGGRQNKKAWQCLTQIEQSLSPKHLILRGLAANECLELSRQLGNPYSEDKVDELYSLSGGNPLYLKEFIGNDFQSSDAFEQLVAERLNSFPEAAIKALSAASVLGREFSFAIWQLCLDTIIPIAALLQSGLVVETSRGFAFEHDLVRASVYDRLSDEARAFWHERVGQSLPVKIDNLATIGWHFEKANKLEKAAWFYHRAASFAHQVDDIEVAQQCCQRALAITAVSHPDSPAPVPFRLLQLQVKPLHSWSTLEEAEFDELEAQVTAQADPDMLLQLLQLKTFLLGCQRQN